MHYIRVAVYLHNNIAFEFESSVANSEQHIRQIWSREYVGSYSVLHIVLSRRAMRHAALGPRFYLHDKT